MSKIKLSLPTDIENKLNSVKTVLTANKQVFVGNESGDFPTLSAAIAEMSKYYPGYTNNGYKCEITIRDGVTIAEQLIFKKIDLSYITINTTSTDMTFNGKTYKVGIVPVDTSGFTEAGGEAEDCATFLNADADAKLPTIGCIFKGINTPAELSGQSMGLQVNKGSSCVISKNCGFINFYDNVSCSNESYLIYREAVCDFATQYGLHIQHGAEVEAKKSYIDGCGIGVYCEKDANLDIRQGTIANCAIAILARNLGRVNGQELIIQDCYGKDCSSSNPDDWMGVKTTHEPSTIMGVVNTQSLSQVNLNGVKIINNISYVNNNILDYGIIHADLGSTIYFAPLEGELSIPADLTYNVEVNTFSNTAGIIYYLNSYQY